MGISNVVALEGVIANRERAPLDDLVRAINIKLQLAIDADNKAGSQDRKAGKLRAQASDHRLDAGRLFLDLHRRVEEEGADWWKWQKGKFTRSRRDIEKLMKMARAADPEVAATSARAKDAQNSRQYRARRKATDAADRQSQLVDDALRAVDPFMRQMTDPQRHEFMAQLQERYLEATDQEIKDRRDAEIPSAHHAVGHR